MKKIKQPRKLNNNKLRLSNNNRKNKWKEICKSVYNKQNNKEKNN